MYIVDCLLLYRVNDIDEIRKKYRLPKVSSNDTLVMAKQNQSKCKLSAILEPGGASKELDVEEKEQCSRGINA